MLRFHCALFKCYVLQITLKMEIKKISSTVKVSCVNTHLNLSMQPRLLGSESEGTRGVESHGRTTNNMLSFSSKGDSFKKLFSLSGLRVVSSSL